MRYQLAATAGMEVVGFEVFEVLTHEFVPAVDGDRSVSAQSQAKTSRPTGICLATTR